MIKPDGWSPPVAGGSRARGQAIVTGLHILI